MKCPFCEAKSTSVKDSRETDEAKAIRRRRHCSNCNGRFTTFERVQFRELIVVKRTGAKRPFDRTKILKSIATALRKRNFTNEDIEQLQEQVSQQYKFMMTSHRMELYGLCEKCRG